LEAYRFSEPRVVLTHPSAIGIAGWLPDGQRLLITRLTPDQSGEYIETFNVKTGELQRYGEWQGFSIVSNPKPVWLASAQAVAFVDVSHNKQNVLLISRGEGLPLEEVVTGLATPYLAVSSDGRRVVFFTAQDRPEAFDVAQAQRQTFPFTLPLTPWQELSALGQLFGPELYRAAWHPNGNQIAFYNDTGFYLADLPSGQICELDLGFEKSEARYGKRWTFHVQWSPNGRYIAALTTVGDPPVHFTDLTLIDMNTGERRYLNLGLQYLYAIAWAPNSHDLLVIAKKGTSENGLELHGLYFINATTGYAKEILADHQFVNIGAWGIAWSPTGQAIALACPVVEPKEHLMIEGRLCIVSVEVTR
jgi:Tol biopolymer transport system component